MGEPKTIFEYLDSLPKKPLPIYSLDQWLKVNEPMGMADKSLAECSFKAGIRFERDRILKGLRAMERDNSINRRGCDDRDEGWWQGQEDAIREAQQLAEEK